MLEQLGALPAYKLSVIFSDQQFPLIVYNMSLQQATPASTHTHHFQIDHSGNLIIEEQQTQAKSKHRQPPLQGSHPRKRRAASLIKMKAVRSKQEHIKVADKEQEVAEPQNQCKCKKSHCIKYYCECFSTGAACGPKCSCSHCQNTTAYQQKHRFKQKPHSNQKICFCTKSNCKKNYCACYSTGVGCVSSCKCFNCQNRASTAMENLNEESMRELPSQSEVKVPSEKQGESVNLSLSQRHIGEDEPKKEKQIWDYLIDE